MLGRRSVLERDVFGYGELGPWKSVKTFAKFWVAKNVRNTAEPVDLTWEGLTPMGQHDQGIFQPRNQGSEFTKGVHQGFVNIW